MNTTNINWAALAAEFDPADVSFRLQGNPRDGKTSAVVVAYLDSRAVQDRLDEVCGPDGWSFDWQPVVTNSTAVLAAKGTLTIAGVSKSDVGDAGQTEPTKASVSDALKRTAVQWGIGRYLYNLPLMYAECVKYGNSWVLAKGEEDRLRREFLRRQPPTATRQPANAAVRAPQPQQPAVAPEATRQHALDAFNEVANQQAQLDLCVQLRKNGHDTPAKVNRMLRAALPNEHTINIAHLAAGESDITMREIGLVLRAIGEQPIQQPTQNGQANGKAATR